MVKPHAFCTRRTSRSSSTSSTTTTAGRPARTDAHLYSYRGIDAGNVSFYLRSDDPRAMYRDYTGCVSAHLACASICTWTLILESLAAPG